VLRRRFLGFPGVALAASFQQDQNKVDRDSVVASATQDTTPRVAIVLSSFKGSEDHDGTPLKGLRRPTAADGPLTATQLEEMVHRAIEFGNTRRGDLAALVGEEDWIVIKPQIVAHRTASGRLMAGSVADPRIVRAVMKWLIEHHAGKRITIAEAPSVSGVEFDPWGSEWDGAFGKVSYRSIVDELAREYSSVRFDIVDLNGDETMDMQTPARAAVSESGVYKVASTLLRCPALITVAPLATSRGAGVSLTVGSYLGSLPAPVYGPMKEKAISLGTAAEVLVDLFSFRPPDYSIVGGEWALEGGDPQTPGAASIRHGLVIGGANAVAVDGIAAAAMGFDPSEIAHLKLASRRGFGITDLDSIWTRGNEIDEARRRFRRAP
jgi:uncharacterized protein (DUF362 family)